MGMSAGGGTGVKSEINVTPLVDVVLVLLIIFMVIVPVLQMGYEATTPKKVESAVPPPMKSDQIIVRMDASGRTFINKEEIPITSFATRLRSATTGREKDVVFFAADGDLEYGKVANFMDLCRNNGAENLGIVFDDLKGR
jgi:biopolymer transport protein TolR